MWNSGQGFYSARKRGSENNDPFCIGSNGEIATEKNDSGGILGGITSGMPVVVRVGLQANPVHRETAADGEPFPKRTHRAYNPWAARSVHRA